MSSWLDFVDQEDFAGRSFRPKENLQISEQDLSKILRLLEEIESRAEEIESLLLELQSKGEP